LTHINAAFGLGFIRGKRIEQVPKEAHGILCWQHYLQPCGVRNVWKQRHKKKYGKTTNRSNHYPGKLAAHDLKVVI